MLLVAFILPCWEEQEVEVDGFFLLARGSAWGCVCFPACFSTILFCHVCVSMLHPCLLPVEHLKHAGCLLLILSAAPRTDLAKVWISSPCRALQNTHLLVLLEQALWLCTEISHLVNRRIAATAK